MLILYSERYEIYSITEIAEWSTSRFNTASSMGRLRTDRPDDSRCHSSLPSRVSQLADLQDHLRPTERRLTEIDNELTTLRANQINESEVTRLLADFHQTWNALAPRDGRQHLSPGPVPHAPQGKIPRISRLMALAIHCDELLRTGQITNQSELARYAQITRARMTQILTLLNLAPDIQEDILFLPRTTGGRGEIQEQHVRRIAMELDWKKQRMAWQGSPLSRKISE